MRTTTVSGTITLNGAPPTASSTYSYDTTAVVHLTELNFGYQYNQDVEVKDNFTFNITVYPGTYKITIENGGYSSDLPYVAYIAKSALDISGPTSGVQLDVRTTTVAGSITLNGAAPTASSTYSYDTTAVVHLTEINTGYQYNQDVEVKDNFTFNMTVYPGTYRITVENGGYSSDLPYVAYIAKTSQAINSPTSGLVLDVKTTSFSGNITLNGATPTASSTYSYDTTAVVHLTEVNTGYQYNQDVEVKDNFTFNIVVYPGTYQVTVENGGYSSDLPYVAYVARSGLAINNTSGVNLDVRTTTISGNITLNGVSPTASSTYSYDTTAVVHLTELTYGYQYNQDVEVKDNFTFNITVYPGTYKITVENGGYSTDLPYVAYVARSSQTISAATSGVNLDVPTTTVSGFITLNGAMPTASSTYSYDTTAVVHLTEVTYGYQYNQDVEVKDNFTFNITVYPGTYRITVENGGYSSDLPYVAYVARTAEAITTVTTNVQLDVPTASICGTITLNGATPTASSTYSYDTTAVVHLTELNTGYQYNQDVEVRDNFTFSITVYPGTYEITVENGGYSSDLPYVAYVARSSVAVP